MRPLWFSPLLVLLATPLALTAPAKRCPLTNYPLTTGCEMVQAPVVYPPYLDPVRLDNVDLVGDTITIGTTWYESQANGTIPQQIVRDSLGFVHVAWMNALDSTAANRHVYYNAHDPGQPYTSWMWNNVGTRVDNYASGYRAGYTGCDVRYGGCAFAYFHTVSTG